MLLPTLRIWQLWSLFRICHGFLGLFLHPSNFSSFKYLQFRILGESLPSQQWMWSLPPPYSDGIQCKHLRTCTLTVVVLWLSSLCPSLDNTHPNCHDLLSSNLHYRSPHIWLVIIGCLLNTGNKNGGPRAFCCYLLPALKKQRPS